MILALYGIDDHPNPLGDVHGIFLFLPLLAAFILAGWVWARSARSAKLSGRGMMIGICAAAIGLLLVAGAVATWL